MAEPSRGLLDTSVVIDHDILDVGLLPDESAISAVTLAELAAVATHCGDQEVAAKKVERLVQKAVGAMLMKYRIASANADHGNYIATAILSHTFATGSAKNGALTDSWNPTLAGGIGITKKIDVESSLGGTLPTGKIATQGRCIIWNSMMQDHIARSFWLELENNATFYNRGSHAGLMQNFITPGAFFVLRKAWKPTHYFLVFNGGMQIATSGFHSYNHNLIAEVRILF